MATGHHVEAIEPVSPGAAEIAFELAAAPPAPSHP